MRCTRISHHALETRNTFKTNHNFLIKPTSFLLTSCFHQIPGSPIPKQMVLDRYTQSEVKPRASGMRFFVGGQ
jgi:hypothetical protein